MAKAKRVKVAKTPKKARVAKTTKAKVAKQKKVAKRVMARKPAVPLKHSADDLKVRRGLGNVPAAARNGMIEVTYAPGADGPEQTVIGGIPFRANEPVAIPVSREDLVRTLALNPHFTTAKVSAKNAS